MADFTFEPEHGEYGFSHGEDLHDHHKHAHDEDSPKGGAPSKGFLRTLFPFAFHSHVSSDAIDARLEASSEGLRALWVSLAGLGLTSVIQLSVVLISGSVALLSDSIHNFADALTALPLGVAFFMGKKRANFRYTYGYGRAEDLAGIFIVFLIATSSVFALYVSLSRLVHPQNLYQISWVIVAGVVGFVGNELIAIYRIRIGKKIGSAALVADGMHARSDGLASLAVVVGAVGVALGFKQADSIMSLFISLAIFAVLFEASREIYRRLMDSVDPHLVAEVKTVLMTTPGIEEVESVRIRWVGHDLRAEVHVLLNGSLTLSESHLIAEDGHHRLLHNIPRLAEAVIHTNPRHDFGEDPHQNVAHHFPEPG